MDNNLREKTLGDAFIAAGTILLFVVYVLFLASVGISMIVLAISLFSKGSIIWGLIVLLIGTPIALGLAKACFVYFVLISILVLAVWGVLVVFGIHVSYGDVSGSANMLLVVLSLGTLAWIGIRSLVAVVKKRIRGSHLGRP